MISDVTFAQIMEDILERVGTYLSLSNGALLKIQPDEENVEMICEWADFVTGVVIGEILDGIMAATQNKLRSIFANYDVTMREALETRVVLLH